VGKLSFLPASLFVVLFVRICKHGNNQVHQKNQIEHEITVEIYVGYPHTYVSFLNFGVIIIFDTCSEQSKHG
jgi:hypothetical protein